MRHTPSNADRALALAGDIEESLWRRAALLVAHLTPYHWPARTINPPRSAGADPANPVADTATPDPDHPDTHALQTWADHLWSAAGKFGQLDINAAAWLHQAATPGTLISHRTEHVGQHQARRILENTAATIHTLRHRWRAYHHALPPDARPWAYATLDEALDHLAQADRITGRTLGSDPVRVRCNNPLGCPSESLPPATGHLLCDACRAHRKRYSEHRTRAAEAALLYRDINTPVQPAFTTPPA